MSRELLGGAPSGPGEDRGTGPDPRRGAYTPTRAPRLGDSLTDLDGAADAVGGRPGGYTAALVAALRAAPSPGPALVVLGLVAALAAGLGLVVARSGQPVPLPVDHPDPWAAAIETRPGALPVTVERPDGGKQQRVVLLGTRVLLVNPGPDPVTVAATTSRGGAVLQIRYPSLPVVLPAGARREVYADLEVACRSPLPLGLPDLEARGDQTPRRPVPVLAGAAELDRACATYDAGSAVAASVSRDGQERLRVDLRTVGGRSIRVVSVSAGSVPLDGTPLPRPIDGTTSTIWLRPPSGCPPRWQRAGLPVTLDLVTEGFQGGDPQRAGSQITVGVGASLAAWLLETSCPP